MYKNNEFSFEDRAGSLEIKPIALIFFDYYEVGLSGLKIASLKLTNFYMISPIVKGVTFNLFTIFDPIP